MTQSAQDKNSSSRRPDAILVRHFPSALNERSVSRGWLRVGIDKEEAKKLAPGVASTLERYGVDTLVSSDLPRARESAEMIAKEMDGDVEIESTPKLRTWNPGDEVAGKKESETIPIRQKFIKYPDMKPKGGEPWGPTDEPNFMDRYRPELKDILARRKRGENVAFVAHGHQLLAAPHILSDEEVDPKNLPSLDERHPPGGVWGLYVNGDKIRIERLDKQESE